MSTQEYKIFYKCTQQRLVLKYRHETYKLQYYLTAFFLIIKINKLVRAWKLQGNKCRFFFFLSRGLVERDNNTIKYNRSIFRGRWGCIPTQGLSKFCKKYWEKGKWVPKFGILTHEVIPEESNGANIYKKNLHKIKTLSLRIKELLRWEISLPYP